MKALHENSEVIAKIFMFTVFQLLQNFNYFYKIKGKVKDFVNTGLDIPFLLPSPSLHHTEHTRGVKDYWCIFLIVQGGLNSKKRSADFSLLSPRKIYLIYFKANLLVTRFDMFHLKSKPDGLERWLRG